MRSFIAVATDPRDNDVTLFLGTDRAAAQIAERLANQDEHLHWRDADPLRRIADAFRSSVTADSALAEAVKAARADGYSWAAIAAMLGVSKQTAQARYGA